MTMMQTQVRLYLDGMYCRECSDVIAKVLRARRGVVRAEVSYARAVAEVTYDTSITDVGRITAAIEVIGYSATQSRTNVARRRCGSLVLVGALALAMWWAFGTGMGSPMQTTMSYGLILVVGLMASLHCVGMCGGIMATQTAVPRDVIVSGAVRPLVPASSYNAGRVLAYTATGAVVGAIGSVLMVRPAAKAWVFVIVGAAMAVMAFQMLQVLPRPERLRLQVPRPCVLPGRAGRVFAARPLILGLLTGLMPCGQLQAMQLYALGTGSALRGAAAMFVFSLGTVPAMLLLGALSTYASKRFRQRMTRVSGVAIAAFGVLMLTRGAGMFAG